MRRRLLAWYDSNRRDLPWRTVRPNPYATLVSELMLQQTQVRTVVPYFLRFMEAFPTVDALARASVDEVLPYWAGLGYYRRCHHLHAAAQRITRELDGVFPDNVCDLQRLPGVGRYTAGAIASIAFGQPVPAIDGNARRVISRLAGIGTEGVQRWSSDDERDVWAAAAQWVSRNRPGDFNQAIMDLGSQVCTPIQPNCPECPLRRFCPSAGCTGRAESSRAVRARPSVKRMTIVTLAIRCGNSLYYRKRGMKGLWAGLWEWPTSCTSGCAPHQSVAGGLLRDVLPRSRLRPRHFHTMTHTLTHRRITFEAFAVDVAVSSVGRANKLGGKWVRLGGEQKLPISTAGVKLISALYRAPS